MARKVFISSDMSVDERLIGVAEQNSQAALIWPWMLSIFDDWGRAEAAPKRLKAALFPAIRSVSAATIATAISLYADAGLITTYEVDGKQYMQIAPEKWFKYQTHIHKDRRDGRTSRYPEAVRASARECAEPRVSTRISVPSPSPSPSLSPSPSKIPPNPPQAGGRAERAKNGSRRRRDVEALKEQRTAVPVEQQLEEARARLLPAVRRTG